jgi:hypothetical protein
MMRQAQKQPPGATTPTPSALLLDDQDRRWQQGCRVPVESYLETSPWLRSDPEGLLDLIYNEVRLREEHGDTPALEEYRRRFPELEEMLARLFEVHRALCSEQTPAGPSRTGDAATG